MISAATTLTEAASGAELASDAPRRWTIDDDLVVEAPELPDTFRRSPMHRGVTDVDRSNGLVVLESWQVEGSPTFATLSVFRNPGESAPQLRGSETVRSPSGLEWVIQRAGENDPRPELVFASATIGAWLIHISGEQSVIDTLISTVSLDGNVEPAP